MNEKLWRPIKSNQIQWMLKMISHFDMSEFCTSDAEDGSISAWLLVQKTCFYNTIRNCYLHIQVTPISIK